MSRLGVKLKAERSSFFRGFDDKGYRLIRFLFLYRIATKPLLIYVRTKLLFIVCKEISLVDRYIDFYYQYWKATLQLTPLLVSWWQRWWQVLGSKSPRLFPRTMKQFKGVRRSGITLHETSSSISYEFKLKKNIVYVNEKTVASALFGGLQATERNSGWRRAQGWH